MLSQRTTKPHSVQWAEAERELAIRGIFLPPYPVSHEYFSIPKDADVQHTIEDPDLQEVVPHP